MRDPSPYAGQTVTLRPDAIEIGGHTAEVVDWYDRLDLDDTTRDYKGQDFATRRGLSGLPDDGQTLYARVDGMMRVIHVSEIEGAPQPLKPGQTCPTCGQTVEER